MSSCLYRTVLHPVLGATLLAGLADAQIVADPSAPRSQQPTVLQTGNGVPLINIQTPSAAGVSRNTFRQFDVPTGGAVLNNSRGGVQTQGGKWVVGNPWLAGGTARVIVNEVNSTQPSLLRGVLEVAGQKAQVIVANPSGISCQGCGFVHADRLTLTTGTPWYSGGALEGFVVRGGTVTVSGDGLDATQVDHAQVLARAMEVNAGLWANSLTVKTGLGATAVGSDGTLVDGAADDGLGGSAAPVGPVPSFALDVAAIGGMYAGKIFLVGSEAGLGVRNAGHLGAEAGHFTLTADGRIENTGTISAIGDVAIKGTGLDNTGSIAALGTVDVKTSSHIDNGGVIVASGAVNVSASGPGAEIRGGPKSTIAAGWSRDGDHWAVLPSTSSDVSIAGSRAGLHGQVLSSGKLDIAAAAVDVSDGELIASSARLGATAGDLDASRARITSTGALTMSAAQVVRTDAATVSAGRVAVRGDGLSNLGGKVIAGSTLDVATRELRNAGGKLTAVGDAAVTASVFDNGTGSVEAAELTVRAGSLTSTGLLYAHGRMDVEAGGSIGNAGTIAAEGELRLAAATIDNGRGVLASRGDQSVTAGSIDNRSGRMASDGAMTIEVVGGVDNRSGRIAASRLDLKAQDLRNDAGTVDADRAALDVRSFDNGSGDVFAGDLAMSAGSFTNGGGRLDASGQLRMNVADVLDNRAGVLRSGGVLALSAGSVSNGGTISGDGGARLSILGTLRNEGAITSQGDMSLAAADIDNRRGTLQADRALELRSAGLLDDTDGTIVGNASLDVAAARVDNTRGSLQSKGHVALRDGTASEAGAPTGFALVNDHGDLLAGSLELRLSRLSNVDGWISADHLSVQAGAIDNRAGVIQQTGSGPMHVVSDASLDNTGGRVIGNGDVKVAAHDLANQGGSITATAAPGSPLRSALTVSAVGGVDNKAGTLAANGGLSVEAASLDNTQGRLSAGQSVDLRLDGALVNARGTVVANGSVDIAVGAVDNSGGTIASLQNALRVGSGGSDAIENRGGRMHAALGLNVTGAGLDNSAGTLSGGAVAIDAGVGNLLVESLQDTSTFTSRQANVGASVSIGYGQSSGSLSASKTNVDSTFRSVGQQSGIKAGDGGFEVNVAGVASLQGGVIASTDKAVADGADRFAAAKLVTRDIDNTASYSARSVGVNFSGGSQSGLQGSGGVVGAGGAGATGGAGGTGGTGMVAPGGAGSGGLGLTGSGMGIGHESGTAASTTAAGISGIAGHTNVRSTDAETGLAPIFDAGKVQASVAARAQLTQAFSRQAPKAVAELAASQAAGLEAQARAEQDPARRVELQAEAGRWQEGGVYRAALHTAAGALGGGAAGAGGAALGAAAAPLLDQLQTGATDALSRAGLDPSAAKLAGRSLASLTAAGAGAAAGGMAAAAAGLTVDSNNRQLHPVETQRIKELAKGDPRTEQRLTQAACALVHCADGIPPNDPAHARLQSLQDAGSSLTAEQALLSQQKGLDGRNFQPLFQYTTGQAFGDLLDQTQAGTRALGAAQAGVGLAGAVGGQLACATGIGCLVTAATKTASVDNLQAGVRTALTGAATPTQGELVLQSLGVDPKTAELAYGVAGTALGSGAAVKAADALGAAVAGKALQVGNAVETRALQDARGVIDPRTGTSILDLKPFTNAQKGMVGEYLGEQTVRGIVPDGVKISRSQTVGQNGIDDLYKVSRPDIDYLKIEYKFVGDWGKTGNTALKNTKDGVQASDSWFLGGNRLVDSVGAEVARDVQRSIIANRTETWVVTIRPDGSSAIQVLDSLARTKPIDTSKFVLPSRP